jgi:hypothetical protein
MIPCTPTLKLKLCAERCKSVVVYVKKALTLGHASVQNGRFVALSTYAALFNKQ